MNVVTTQARFMGYQMLSFQFNFRQLSLKAHKIRLLHSTLIKQPEISVSVTAPDSVHFRAFRGEISPKIFRFPS